MIISVVLAISFIFALTMHGAFVLHEKRYINYESTPFKSALYFAIPVSLLLAFFRETYLVFSYPTLKMMVTLLLFISFMLLLPIFLKSAFVLRGKTFLRSSLGNIKFNYRYIFSKSSELVFQQICIVLLVNILAGLFDKSIYLMILFSLIFGLLHIGLFPIIGRLYGFIFVSASFLAGLIFPLIILFEPNGILYTVILHWFFYITLFFLYQNRMLGEKSLRKRIKEALA